MLKKKLFLLFCLPFILGLFMLNGCGTVTPVAVIGVTLDKPIMTLTAGGAIGILVATVAPADATNQSVTWSSSAPIVATVVNGVVIPLTSGTTNIKVVTVDGGLTATCTVTVNPVVAVGDSYGGGIVAYILQSGEIGYIVGETHGLIAATADQSTGIRWWNGSYIITGATGTALGTGLANTNTIIAAQGAIATSYAAGLAQAYNGGGYSDWYLPSKDELNKLYLNRVAIGGFAAGDYWSSSEVDAYNAWAQDFDNGYQGFNVENSNLRVRAVRAF